MSDELAEHGLAVNQRVGRAGRNACALPHNLPGFVTSLVGRKAELSNLAGVLATHRLVTVVGPGGVGKTRLAAELSERIVQSPVDPPAGVEELRWLDLAAATDASEVVHACARLLVARLEVDSRDPVSALVSRIRRRQSIIVFDTCEHVLGPVAELVERVLEGCPGITVLATSREPLGIPGEAVWRVPILSARDATELFVERARLAAHDVDVSAGDPLVSAICDRLDGLPLAIELAAPWMRVFTSAQILAGLDERFRLLTGGLRRGTPRHRTLEASMAWSHDLLDDVERFVFRRLAVFVGDFEISAVEEICGPLPDRGEDLTQTVARLVDKSLIVTNRVDDHAQYGMLDTVREYAAEMMTQAGEVARVRDRHLSWCLHRMRHVDETLRRDQDAGLRLFDEIETNATAALDWALQPDNDRRTQGRQLAHLMVMPWFLRSQSHRGRPLLNRAIAQATEPDDGLQDLLVSDIALLGIVAGRRGLASEPTEAADSGDTARLAHARFTLVNAYETFFADHEEGERAGIAASAQGDEAGDPLVEDFSLIMSAYSLTARERHNDAQALLAPAAARARERGDRFCGAFAMGVTQYGAMQSGHLTEAVRLGREMVDLIAPLGDYFGQGTLTVNLALALCLNGDLDSAREVMTPIADVAVSDSEIDVVALPVSMGYICLRAGEWEDAARWFGRGLARLDSGRSDWTAARCLPGAVEALRRLGREAEASELAERGQALGIDAPGYVADLAEQRAHLLPRGDPLAGTLYQRALDLRVRFEMLTFIPDSLDALARHQANERPREATYLLAASSTARDRMGYPRAVGTLGDHEALVTELKAMLGSDDFDIAWSDGSAASLDDAVKQAQRGRRRPARPSTGWASLTPAELNIARLIAQGLTNAQIAEQLVLSRATVKTHLYHAFTKLDITNRTELARIATDHSVNRDD